jgi:SAM-dependent methyltransferase
VPLDILECPVCSQSVTHQASFLECRSGHRFPLVNGVPILINEHNSVFQIREFLERIDTFFITPSRIRSLIFGLSPDLSVNYAAKVNYRRLEQLLFERSSRPRVLVLGGSILGAGMKKFRANPAIEFIDTDVAFGPLTKAICDAHGLPFQKGTFDAVVAQAVLEHVCDPYRCVDEIHRVLKPGGLVYAETPFMVPAHSTPYDFHRFTYVGYRRLFKRYEQIGFGPVGGPAQALAHQCESTFLCAGKSRAAHAVTYFAVRWMCFWWKYLDRVLNKNPHALHCAFGLFFLGSRSENIRSDRDIVDEMRHI